MDDPVGDQGGRNGSLAQKEDGHVQQEDSVSLVVTDWDKRIWEE